MGALLIMIAAGTSVTFLATTLYYRGRWLGARDALDALRDRQPHAFSADKTLQRSMDAIAVEVERVSESQRFIARLLAERRGPILGEAPNSGDQQQREPAPVLQSTKRSS